MTGGPCNADCVSSATINCLLSSRMQDRLQPEHVHSRMCHHAAGGMAAPLHCTARLAEQMFSTYLVSSMHGQRGQHATSCSMILLLHETPMVSHAADRLQPCCAESHTYDAGGILPTASPKLMPHMSACWRQLACNQQCQTGRMQCCNMRPEACGSAHREYSRPGQASGVPD